MKHRSRIEAGQVPYDGESDAVERHDNIREMLGLYVLDALQRPDLDVLQAHLPTCAECTAEYDYLCEVPGFLEMLTDQDLLDLVGEVDLRSAEEEADDWHLSSPARSDHASRRPASRRPTGRAPNARPARGRTRGGMRVLLAVAAVALGAGVALGSMLHPAPAPTTISTFMAAATDTSTGVSASVQVVGHGSGFRVQMTAHGLTAGVSYQLYVVTLDGRTQIIAEFIGAGGTQVVPAHASAATDQIGFFTVAQVGGAAVVSVPFAQSAPTSTLH
jgi:putative zinc finger protein